MWYVIGHGSFRYYLKQEVERQMKPPSTSCVTVTYFSRKGNLSWSREEIVIEGTESSFLFELAHLFLSHKTVNEDIDVAFAML